MCVQLCVRMWLLDTFQDFFARWAWNHVCRYRKSSLNHIRDAPRGGGRGGSCPSDFQTLHSDAPVRGCSGDGVNLFLRPSRSWIPPLWGFYPVMLGQKNHSIWLLSKLSWLFGLFWNKKTGWWWFPISVYVVLCPTRTKNLEWYLVIVCRLYVVSKYKLCRNPSLILIYLNKNCKRLDVTCK